MYAQSNYPNTPQGIPPTRYTIKDVGCFITSFCNLLSRFGHPVDPPTINAFFRDKNLYTDVDDGYRDDVAWDYVTKYNSNCTVTKVGSGAPPSNNSIVKFVYNGGRSTHFCLVNDARAGTIIDSWDGKVKSWTTYGGPVAYAVYNYKGATQTPSKGGTVSKQALTKEEVISIYTGFFRVPDSQANKDVVKAFTGKPLSELLQFLHRDPTYKKLLAKGN